MAISTRAFSSSASHPRPMGRIAPGGCLPGTAAAIGCTARSIATVSRTRLNRKGAMTGSASTPPTSPRSPTARHQITSRRARKSCVVVPFLLRELEAMTDLRVVLALGRIGFDGFLAAWRDSGRELPKPKAQVYARLGRHVVRRVAPSRKLPSEPAEHVHWEAHALDVPPRVQKSPSSRGQLSARDARLVQVSV